MIRVGTSGYSFKDWIGPFYPSGIPERDMLPYYAGEFVNSDDGAVGVRVEIGQDVLIGPGRESDSRSIGFLHEIAPGQQVHSFDIDKVLDLHLAYHDSHSDHSLGQESSMAKRGVGISN